MAGETCKCIFVGSQPWCGHCGRPFAPPIEASTDAEGPQKSKWQPIASAPHGQRILALVGGKPEWVYGAVGDEQQEWTFDDTGELCHPTHWMPLPSPPTEEKK